MNLFQKYKIQNLLIFALILLTNTKVFSQKTDSKVIAYKEAKEWPEIPGLHHGGGITLTNEKIFLRVAGAATVSYILAKFVFKSEKQGDYWQVRGSYAIGEYKTVIKEHFGVERRISPWFAVALEVSFQQWFDERNYLSKTQKTGFGVGLQPYFRWHIFGKKRLSPYLEYGTGFYQGFSKFPHNGTNFTFTHSSHLGLEYTSKKGSKWRLSYGQFHQSNNDWWEKNPSYNANGFNLTYSWKIK
ncbi:acyloxyacyl hydrolase [Aureivirga sp. CE67]|uniref:acyloxyacyl hydrolase n=1 Tax=Aureivirga sp. CE67 TaxID=1788983 RepID=UPI0018C9A108|nr:acyloxyacyl hydrolase [Aureivirga sp. CE67]